MNTKFNFKEKYNLWVKNSEFYPEFYEELLSINNNENEIYERFHKDIDFGTAGVRAIMGAGTNRINTLVVSRISQAASIYLKENFESNSVLISYDTRKNSFLYAKTTAQVFSGNNILTYIFKDPTPTPMLSFISRKLKCNMAIMITASHNSCEYNGYKIYGQDGGQIPDTSLIYEKILKIDIFNDIKTMDFKKSLEKNKIMYVKKILENDYDDFIIGLFKKEEKLNINIIYSPLNGCASKIVENIFKKINIKKFLIVESQRNFDCNFTTCPNPNPEKYESFNEAIELAKKNNSDAVILNDPDGDRVGLAVLHDGVYKILDGNEIGALILYYLIFNKKLNSQNIVIKSIVSDGLVNKLVEKFNLKLIETPPGFKYISRHILKLEEENKINEFLFAFEESQGYIFDTQVRDKDGISAMAIICKIINFYKEKNMTLIDLLYKLYKEYGFFITKKINLELKNIKKIDEFIEEIKLLFLDKFDNIEKYYNFKKSFCYNLINKKLTNLKFPKSDIYMFCIKNDSQKIILRPSGTEPIIKFYISSFDKNYFEANKNLIKIIKTLEKYK